MRRDFFAYLGGTAFWAVVGIVAVLGGFLLFEWLMLGGPGIFNFHGHAVVTIHATAQPQYDNSTPHS
jgi:hypothetical protein